MDQLSDAPQNIQSLPTWDGDPLAPWVSVRAYFASRTCAQCGALFYPKKVRGYKGKMIFEGEGLFNLRQCCGKSCAKRLKNPMHNEASVLKMRQSLKAIGHKPSIRRGNGTGPTEAEMMMSQCLGQGWKCNAIVRTMKSPSQGYPRHYKVDVTNEALMIAIELDGNSHFLRSRKEQDRKKDCLLRSLGWKVLRLKNSEAMSLCTTYGSQVIHHILQMAS